MGCRRAIYNNIASSTSDFFRTRIKNALVQGRALGHFLTSDEKNLGLGAILLCIALRHPIFTLQIYHPERLYHPCTHFNRVQPSFQPCATVYMPCTHLNRVQPFICPVLCAYMYSQGIYASCRHIFGCCGHIYGCCGHIYGCTGHIYGLRAYIWGTGHIYGCTRFK